jgi:hypothetical protein
MGKPGGNPRDHCEHDRDGHADAGSWTWFARDDRDRYVRWSGLRPEGPRGRQGLVR